MKYEDLTREIIRACYVVSNDLGSGFVESVYHRALNVALEERGLLAQSSVPLEVRFHNHVVGEFVADMIVNGSVLLELKAVTALRPEHQAQVINYLNATGGEVGLLVNFGRPKPEVRRCTRGTNGTRWATAQIV